MKKDQPLPSRGWRGKKARLSVLEMARPDWNAAAAVLCFGHQPRWRGSSSWRTRESSHWRCCCCYGAISRHDYQMALPAESGRSNRKVLPHLRLMAHFCLWPSTGLVGAFEALAESSSWPPLWTMLVDWRDRQPWPRSSSLARTRMRRRVGPRSGDRKDG